MFIIPILSLTAENWRIKQQPGDQYGGLNPALWLHRKDISQLFMLCDSTQLESESMEEDRKQTEEKGH